jgi:hypothetical protein
MSDIVPLKIFTIKDGDETKTVQCFSEDQIKRVEGYLMLRAQYESDCKEELARINSDWDQKKAVLAKRYASALDDANKGGKTEEKK